LRAGIWNGQLCKILVRKTSYLGLFDISETTDCVVFHEPTRQLLVCSTGDTIDRQVFGNLLVVAKFLLRVKIGVLLFSRLLIQLYDRLALEEELCER
jgi:hypothetical protein